MDIGGWFKNQDSGGWLAACLPRPALSPSQVATLAGLGSRLAELGYTEHAVREWLEGTDLAVRRFQQVPSYRASLRRVNSPAARLAGFALIREELSLPEAREIFGDCLELLNTQGMLEIQGDTVRPLADLYPCEGAYLFADLKFSPFKRFPNHVYEVGGDSYSLARSTPRWANQAALDLCTGSGVHAVLAARHSKQVTGVDINSRAVDFSSLNAIINGVHDHCSFVLGSLYEPVAGRRFDLITANTPFVPTPTEEQLEAYRWGGEDGDDINRALVAGLTEHLNPGGCLALFTNYTVLRGGSPLESLDRMAGWLGGGEGWGLSLLHFSSTPRESYIELQIQWGEERYQERFERWVEVYEQQGILAIGEGTFLIRRLPPGHPGYRERLDTPHPLKSHSNDVRTWLEALERYSDPRWQPDWEAPAQLHPGLEALLADARGGPAYTLDWRGHNKIDRLDFALATGEGPLGGVVERLSLSRAEARERLADLGRRMVLQL